MTGSVQDRETEEGRPDTEKIRGLLTKDAHSFEHEIRSRAEKVMRDSFDCTLHVSGLIALSNICRNQCTYCGLRSPRKDLPRFRLTLEEMKEAVDSTSRHGIQRVFLVSGDDPGLDPDVVEEIIEYAKQMGFHVSLGLGVLSAEVLSRYACAGLDCYALKFETSNREIFSRVKPDSDFDERMQSVLTVRQKGMELGSANIIGLPGETVSDIAEDIELMCRLGISWAPAVPYIPVPGTPMAETSSMGNVDLVLREISILRLFMPDVLITAGQPSQGSQLGFADPAGNRDAIRAGADLFFVDFTPSGLKENFEIVRQRRLSRIETISEIAEELDMEWQ